MTHDTPYFDRHYARFYDWVYDEETEDVGFYVQAPGEFGSPVLELACGTGRLAIPIARAGFEITGFDFSAEMLAIARAKLDREPVEVESRLRLVKADMADFSLPERFNLAFVPVSSIFHLHTMEQKASCFACVHRHLNRGGAFIVDVTPAHFMADQPVGETKEYKHGLNPATGKMTRELNRKLAIDQGAQIVTVEHTYTEEEPGGAVLEFTFTDQYAWVTEPQLRGLLEDAGFGNIEVYGDYDKGPFTVASPRMIFTAKR